MVNSKDREAISLMFMWYVMSSFVWVLLLGTSYTDKIE